MAAFMRRTWTFTKSTHLSLMLPSKMLSVLLQFPTSFVRTGRSWSCIDGSCISCFETLSLELQYAQVLNLLSIFLSTHLRISDFLLWRGLHRFPCCYFHFFLFIDILRIEKIIKILWRVFSLYGLRDTKFNGLAFALVSPLVSLHLKSPLGLFLTWRSVFRSDQDENHWNGCKRTSRNSYCWRNEEEDSIHHAKNFIWLASRRVGFWFQHVRFGFSVLNWSCRTTNQAHLCGFWTRVSSLDFVLW